MRIRRLSDILRTLFLLASAISAIYLINKGNQEYLDGNVHIIDGDSLKLNGREIRLFGIDAPEYGQTCKDQQNAKIYPCGKSARNYLVNLLSKRDVFCKGSETDKYDRLLAICMAGDLEINRQMVLDGWALSFGWYHSEEAQAEYAKRGLWASEFQTPSAWRKNKAEVHSVNWVWRLYKNWFE